MKLTLRDEMIWKCQSVEKLISSSIKKLELQYKNFSLAEQTNLKFERTTIPTTVLLSELCPTTENRNGDVGGGGGMLLLCRGFQNSRARAFVARVLGKKRARS